jgi:uncharacterized membrane protein (DUF2068 family)
MLRRSTRSRDDGPARPSARAVNLIGWHRAELRIVALIEFAKGALVLAVGAGLLAFAHRDLQDIVEELLLHLHLNPASRIPGIFIELASRANSINLWLLALGALVYSTIRIAEGYGLWYDHAWAEWLGAVSGLIYVPFELYALSKGITLLKLGTLALNLIVVTVLIESLIRRRRSRR